MGFWLRVEMKERAELERSTRLRLSRISGNLPEVNRGYWTAGREVPDERTSSFTVQAPVFRMFRRFAAS